jgi:hypothetical protein
MHVDQASVPLVQAQKLALYESTDAEVQDEFDIWFSESPVDDPVTGAPLAIDVAVPSCELRNTYAEEQLREQVPQLFCPIQPSLRIQLGDVSACTAQRIQRSATDRANFAARISEHIGRIVSLADVQSAGAALFADQFENDALIYAQMLVGGKKRCQVLAEFADAASKEAAHKESLMATLWAEDSF